MIIETIESESISIFQLRESRHRCLSDKDAEWNYFQSAEKMDIYDIAYSTDIRYPLSYFKYKYDLYTPRDICRINDRTLRYWSHDKNYSDGV